MIPDALPPELLALERELTDHPRPEVPTGLRARVLATASREVSRLSVDRERRDLGRFVAATAAAVLLAINLSASVASNTRWHLRPPPAGTDVADAARRIRGLAPEVSEREALRQALLLRAAAGLAPCPVPTADLKHWNKEPERWRMH